MMVRPLLVGALFAFLLLPAASAAELPALGSDPVPDDPVDPDSLDPTKTLDQLRQHVGDGSGGDNVPLPPGGGGDGVLDIAPRVGSVLAENWAVTGVIAVGLVGAAVSGWVLASRYVDPKVALTNPQRSMLYGFVKGNPGVHLKQLSTEFRMKTSTVLWHVRKLEAADLVRSKKANGYRVFYPVTGGLEARQLGEAVTALSNQNARHIFEYISVHPGVAQRSLAGHLRINPGTVRWHLKKLRQAGLLQESGTARSLAYFPTEIGLKAFRQTLGQPQPVTTPIVPAPAAGAVVVEEPPVFN